ncbi:unnamed protein product [Caenorhabditis angaria]|uniref:Follistatin-like domain-containing protein n=1 Tax=Caenorhabditis angaria TaxID=860376 RepID=A0A9P1N800_9PELO|nr:unnamed protein product [Caenorhabditis angaria]
MYRFRIKYFIIILFIIVYLGGLIVYHNSLTRQITKIRNEFEESEVDFQVNDDKPSTENLLTSTVLLKPDFSGIYVREAYRVSESEIRLIYLAKNNNWTPIIANINNTWKEIEWFCTNYTTCIDYHHCSISPRIGRLFIDPATDNGKYLKISTSESQEYFKIPLNDKRSSSKRTYEHGLGVCLQPVFYLTDWTIIIQFFESWIAQGATKFYFYINSYTEKSGKVLQFYKETLGDNLELIDWSDLPVPSRDRGIPDRDPNAHVFRYGATAFMHDCMLRARNIVKFVSNTDLDDFPFSKNMSILNDLETISKRHPKAGQFAMDWWLSEQKLDWDSIKTPSDLNFNIDEVKILNIDNVRFDYFNAKKFIHRPERVIHLDQHNVYGNEKIRNGYYYTAVELYSNPNTFFLHLRRFERFLKNVTVSSYNETTNVETLQSLNRIMMKNYAKRIKGTWFEKFDFSPWSVEARQVIRNLEQCRKESFGLKLTDENEICRESSAGCEGLLMTNTRFIKPPITWINIADSANFNNYGSMWPKTGLLIFIGLLAFCQAQLSLTRSDDCGDNETYQTCGSACEPSCDTPNPSFCTLQCVIGCQCDTGYVRNSKKACVKYEQCTETSASSNSSATTSPNLGQVLGSTTSPSFNCAANETYSDCHSPCTEAKCPTSGTTEAVACITMCMQGCACKSGYVRNNQGECVLSEDCGVVAQSNPCETVDCRSGMICETQNGKPICVQVKPTAANCAAVLCMNGYNCVTRLGKARCVRAAMDIPSITCRNVRCGTSGGCAMVEPAGCSGSDCVAQPMCIESNPCHHTKCTALTECVLKQVTCIMTPCNPIAECVPKKASISRQKRNRFSDDFLPKCPENESMVSCKNACSEEVCNQKERFMCTQECSYAGCACSSGFYRHPNGKFEQEEDQQSSVINGTSCAMVRCSSETECEEIESCDDSGSCSTKASCVKRVELNSTISGCETITCPVGETCQQITVNCLVAPCPPVVTCLSDNYNSTDVPTQGCDVVQCESDEVCQEDAVECEDETCPVRISCVKYVEVNTTSTTISTCSTNETFSQCTNPCSESKCIINTDFICNRMCVAGCTCETGYKRNTTGHCVLSDDCPIVVEATLNSTTCGVNETLTECYNSCSEEKCAGIPSFAQCTTHCRVGCGCSDGYARSNDGKCYKELDCPDNQICGKNEDYRCEGCDATCSNLYPKCDTKNCTKSCQCAKGFVRINGNCVTFKKCSSLTTNNITCLATEKYTDCLPKCWMSCTGNQECDSEIDENVCTAGCVCRDKYKKDTNGECVHNRHCYKSTDCVDNEEWVKCKDTDLTCATFLGSTTKAPTHDSCNSGCACVDNYARNANGTCVPTSECA